jgi:hypothetical protein
MATPSSIRGDASGSGSERSGRKGVPWWIWAVITLFVVVVGLWGVAVVSQPGLRRAAIAGNEASAIGYIRAVASAEALAVEFNKGFPLPLSCLSEPAQCPPAVSALPLLSGSLTDSYAAYFTVLSSPTPEEIAQAGAVARSVKTWVLVVLPRQPGVTAQRVFCTDTTGEISFTADANTLPDTSGGRCGNTQPLR